MEWAGAKKRDWQKANEYIKLCTPRASGQKNPRVKVPSGEKKSRDQIKEGGGKGPSHRCRHPTPSFTYKNNPHERPQRKAKS